jgi:biopolymer transport protein ExbB/TolQ|nr:MAG: hypothetical protein [Microviridae sp.]
MDSVFVNVQNAARHVEELITAIGGLIVALATIWAHLRINNRVKKDGQ